jgi:hypothetical protein
MAQVATASPTTSSWRAPARSGASSTRPPAAPAASIRGCSRISSGTRRGYPRSVTGAQPNVGHAIACLFMDSPVAAAMSDFKLKPWNRGISDAELLADLRRVADLLGKTTVAYKEYPNHGRCSSRIFATRFGSWNAALRAAGLELGHREDISEEELFENMERVWTALGRQPRRQEMKSPSPPSRRVLMSEDSAAGAGHWRSSWRTQTAIPPPPSL